MKCVQTIAGVLAIVGLGYIAGVGHSLVRELPVILGPASNTKAPDIKPPGPNTPETDDPGIVEPPETDPVSESDPESIPEFDPMLDAPVPEGMLSLRKAHQFWLEGAYFVDSRLRDEYDEGHIALAAYLTAETLFTDEGEAEMNTIPPDATVVIYCLGGDECDASLNTKAILEQFGFTDLSIMGVGYDEWAAAGLPTESNIPSNTEEGTP